MTINGNSFFKNIYIPSNTALHFTNNLTQGVSHKIHEYGASGYLEFRTSATGADGDSTINAEINTIGEWHFYNNIQLCRNGTYLYIGNNRARFLNQSDGIYFQTYRNNTWNTDWFINYTVGKVQFPSNIIAPNIASAAAELLSAQQEITAQDLEMIEIQQTLTEQDLDNIETQQTLTEQDLANIEGGLCNE